MEIHTASAGGSAAANPSDSPSHVKIRFHEEPAVQDGDTVQEKTIEMATIYSSKDSKSSAIEPNSTLSPCSSSPAPSSSSASSSQLHLTNL